MPAGESWTLQRPSELGHGRRVNGGAPYRTTYAHSCTILSAVRPWGSPSMWKDQYRGSDYGRPRHLCYEVVPLPDPRGRCYRRHLDSGLRDSSHLHGF